MRFYKPYQYVYWGAILVVVDAIPNIGILGFFLVMFGIALELIERRFGRPDEELIERRFGRPDEEEEISNS